MNPNSSNYPVGNYHLPPHGKVGSLSIQFKEKLLSNSYMADECKK